MPTAHATPPSCTYNYSSPPFQQWTISLPGVYCLSAGTFDTQITITVGGVTLKGAGASTIIQPSSVTNNAVDPVYGNPEEAVIYAYSGTGISGVTIESLTVDGSIASSSITSCGSATLGYYIGILFSGVTGTINYTTVTNLYQASPSLYGCQSDAGLGIVAGTPVGVTSTVSINHDAVTNYQKGGIVCWELGTFCTISDNNVSPLPAAAAANAPNGIQIGGPGGAATVTGNTVSGNFCGLTSSPPTPATCGPDLIAQAQGTGILTYESSGPVTISGNTLTGNDVGIYLAYDNEAIATTSNTIMGSTYVGMAVYDESQTVSGNAFSSEPVGIEAVSDTSGLTATATVGGNTFLGVTTPSTTETANGGLAEILSMIPPFASCTATYDPASNVPFQQLAISEPGRYCFDAGTYDTQITVTASNVVLENVGAGSAIIQPTASTITANAVDPDTSAPEASVILATGVTGVTISNLIIDGSVASSYFAGGSPQFIGILFLNANGTITGSTVENIYPPAGAAGDQIGNAVEVQTASGLISTVTMSSNHAINYDKNGITCNDFGTTCSVAGNTVYPYAAYQADTASNGIQIAYGATGTVSGNTVSGNACTDYYSLSVSPPSYPYGCGPEEYVSTGILASGTSGVTISGNTLTGNDMGIYATGDTGPVSITSNSISDSTYTAIGVYYESVSVTITGNTVSGTVASPTTCTLVPLESPGYTGCGPNLITQYQAQGIDTYGNSGPVSISTNNLTDNDVGIYLQSDTGTITSTSNGISGSTYVGMAVYDESQTVSGNAFSSEPVGIEAVSDTSGLTATATISGNTFLGVTLWSATETANGGTAYAEIPSGTAVTCIPTSFAIGSTSKCTASVSGKSSPTGTVTFTQSGTGTVTLPIPATCTLVSGSCYITVTGATAGSFTITATYSGDPNNAASYGTTTTLIVKATTTIALNCGSAITVGATATCTATVSGAYGSVNSETVSFTASGAGTFSSTTCALSGIMCSVTYTPVYAGTQTITAAYPGDTYNAGSSGQATLAVNSVTSPPVTVVCTPSPVSVGGRTECKVTVLGSPTPTGKVTWSGASGLGSFSTSTCKLNRGSCHVYFTATSAGDGTILATYSGDAHNPTSSNTFNLVVSQATSRTTISCRTRVLRLGFSTTCTAIVTGYHPTGTVTWFTTGFGAVTFAGNVNTCNLVEGRCSVTITATVAGEIVLHATYAGDTNNLVSSNTVTLVISSKK